MQTRPFPEDDGVAVWLSRLDRERLLSVYRGEYPRRYLAFELGLHGLRTDEIVGAADSGPGITKQHFREFKIDGSRYSKVIVEDGKSGWREAPASEDLRQRATMLANAADLRQDDRLVDVTPRTVRKWIEDAREELLEETGEDAWRHVSMHDLRRSWATDCFYTLAAAGVPIAEELTMGWGGWKMTPTGRSTFRENYLGPEPDHVAAEAMDVLPV